MSNNLDERAIKVADAQKLVLRKTIARAGLRAVHPPWLKTMESQSYIPRVLR